MSDLTEHLQEFDLGEEVALYQLDCSVLGAGAPVLLFTPSTDEGARVKFDGDTYVEAPIEAEGFDQTLEGGLPQPTLRVSNVSRLLVQHIQTYDDLLGCELTRILIFEQFLDGHAEEDATAYHRRDVYIVEAKVRQDSTAVEFLLTSPLDQEGQLLPRRSVLKRTCPRRYRELDSVPDPEEFTNFEQMGGCPYRGATYAGPVTEDPYEVDGTTGPYYKADNTETTEPSEDECGKTLLGCIARYGQASTKPFGAFPGAGPRL